MARSAYLCPRYFGLLILHGGNCLCIINCVCDVFLCALTEIVDGNVKMTLGMIWTIILRFAIQDISVEGV